MGRATEFQSVLEREVEAHDRLLQLKAREQEAIAWGTVDEIDKVVDEIQSVLGEIGNLEREREARAGEIAAESGLKAGTTRLQDILPFLDEEKRTVLCELGGRLHDRILRLRRLNEDTAFVVRHSLDWIHQVLSAAGGALEHAESYGTSGAAKGRVGSPASLLVNTHC